MNFVKYRKIFFLGSILLIILALTLLVLDGLKLGSDFVGGAVMEIEYAQDRPNLEEIRIEANKLPLDSLSIQPMGDKGLIIKAKAIDPEVKNSLDLVLSAGGKSQFTDLRFSEVGPSLGKELSRKGLIAVALVVLLMILFIAFAFYQVSAHRMPSWKYGVVSIVALAHDVLIAVGLMALLGYLFGAEADALFLTALLTILGLSINNTIVVFDRIRENLNRHASNDFAEVVNFSIKETSTRSINTTLTTVLVLICLFVWGPESTRYFAVILTVGMLVGTYSSVLIAPNLLVEWEAWQRGKAVAKAKR